MANTTDASAADIHGMNPQNLVEKILRQRIYANAYWKEHCFALNEETLVDKAMELQYVGGTYGGNRMPTPFICLVLKMLQLQPEQDVVIEFIKNEDYKYVRALGAFYLRLVGRPRDVYRYLEPLYNDYRKLRFRSYDGFVVTHMDEFVNELLRSETQCDIALPAVTKRTALEQTVVGARLPARVSAVSAEFAEGLAAAEAGAKAEAEGEGGGRWRHKPKHRHRHRGEGEGKGEGGEHRSRGRRKSRERSGSPSGDRDRSKSGKSERRKHRSHRSHRSRSPGRERRGGAPAVAAEPVDPEIAEANALRAKLGIKPLRS